MSTMENRQMALATSACPLHATAAKGSADVRRIALIIVLLAVGSVGAIAVSPYVVEAAVDFVGQAGSAFGALSDRPLIGILFAMFAGSVVSGLAGFAFSAVAGALLLLWLPPSEAVPILLVGSIATQLISITSLWKVMQWRRSAPLIFGGLLGIPIGAELLRVVDARVFAAGFGAFLTCYSAFTLLRPNVTIRGHSGLADVVAGFAGGVTGGSIAFPGAIPTIWCSLQGMAKNVQRGLVQPFILILQLATLVYFSKIGMLTTATAAASLWCAPAVVGGTFVGVRLFNHVNDAIFRKLVLAFLLVSGAILVIM